MLRGFADETGEEGTERQWLRYRHDAGFTRGVNRSYYSLRSADPSGATLPTFTAGDPQYFRWKTPLADTDGVLIALDRSRKNGLYDRLYVDTNADGNLADEKPKKPDSGSQWSSEFNGIRMVLPTEEGNVTYHLTIHLSTHGGDLHVSAGTACWYENTIKLGDETRNIRLFDHNANGVFNDMPTSESSTHADRIFIQEGKEFVEYWLASMIRAGDSYYRCEVSPDGSWIRLREEWNIEFGSIRLAEEYEELQIAGENGFYQFKSTNRVHQVPVGHYTSPHWVLNRKDQRGVRWRLTGRQNSEPFEVIAGQETEILVGLPLEGTLRVTAGHKKIQVRVNVRAKGRGHFDLDLNHQRAPPPTIIVESSDGSYHREHRIRSGSFRWADVEIPVPPDTVEAYTITAKYPGPFEVEVEPYEVGPVLQLATHPASTNAIEIIWEINRAIAYEGTRYRTCTGAFIGSNQVQRLQGLRFHVHRGVDGETFEPIGTVVGPTNHFLDTPVPDSHLFYYRVVATEDNGTEWGVSTITMGAAGENLIAHPSFETFTNGVFRKTGVATNGLEVDDNAFAVEDGSRPYSKGRKVLSFDPNWIGTKQISFQDNLIPLSTNIVYLSGSWVYVPGNAWYGRFFYDKNRKAYNAYGYSMPSVHGAAHWTFGVQALIADPNWEGSGQKGTRPTSMAKKGWTFPAVASYLRPFVTAFGEGKLDDHWIVAVTNAPNGTILFDK